MAGRGCKVAVVALNETGSEDGEELRVSTVWAQQTSNTAVVGIVCNNLAGIVHVIDVADTKSTSGGVDRADDVVRSTSSVESRGRTSVGGGYGIGDGGSRKSDSVHVSGKYTGRHRGRRGGRGIGGNHGGGSNNGVHGGSQTGGSRGVDGRGSDNSHSDLDGNNLDEGEAFILDCVALGLFSTSLVDRLSVAGVSTLAKTGTLGSSNSGGKRSEASARLDGHSGGSDILGGVGCGDRSDCDSSISEQDLSSDESIGNCVNTLLHKRSGGRNCGHSMNDNSRGRGDGGGDGGGAVPVGRESIRNGVGGSGDARNRSRTIHVGALRSGAGTERGDGEYTRVGVG